MKVLLYFSRELSPLAPEWGEMSDEVLAEQRERRRSWGGWHRLLVHGDFEV